jgi:hypothetical protein
MGVSEDTLRKLFDTVDSNRSGAITVDELLAQKAEILAGYGALFTKFDEIDKNGDAAVSWPELLYYFRGGEASLKAWLDYTLSTIIGLEQLKEQIQNFATALQMDQARRAKGHKVEAATHFHMIFQGNPGTGKTSLARIMASLLKRLQVPYCATSIGPIMSAFYSMVPLLHRLQKQINSLRSNDKIWWTST